MPDNKEFDLNKCVLIQRHDNSLYAIPLDRLEEFRLDEKTTELVKNTAKREDLEKQQKAFVSNLVAGPGCYRG